MRGVSKGHCWSKLLLIGLGDGVRCSRSLLCGLPPPTCLYLSLGADRIGFGSILIVENGEGDPGPVQSNGVLPAGGVVASADGEGCTLLGEGGVPSPCLCRSVSIPCTRDAPSCLIV